MPYKHASRNVPCAIMTDSIVSDRHINATVKAVGKSYHEPKNTSAVQELSTKEVADALKDVQHSLVTAENAVFPREG